ncbi:MAG: nucleotidyltransferase domain-containing protein [Acidimicrobiales bacterium]
MAGQDGRRGPASVEAETTEALRQAGARFAFVHGSRAKGTASSDSDLDVAACWGHDAPAPWKVPLPAHVDLLVIDGTPLELAGRVAMWGPAALRRRPPRPGALAGPDPQGLPR